METFTEMIQRAINTIYERGGCVASREFGVIVKRQFAGMDIRTIGRPQRPVLKPVKSTLAQLVAHDVQFYQEMQEERFQELFKASKRDMKKAIYDPLTGIWHLKEYIRKDVFTWFNIKTRINWDRDVYMYIECLNDEVLRGEITI